MNKILKKLFNKKNMRGGGHNNNLNIIILIVVILMFLYMYYQNNQNNQTNKNVIQTSNISTPMQNDKIYNSEKQKEEQKVKKIVKIKQQNQNPQLNQEIIDPEIIVPEIYPILREYDYRTLSDPLTPPYKRDDDMIPANVIAPDLFGIYTQGGPLPFIKVGKLVDNKAKNDETYKFLILFGRRRYSGSNLYDYYATTTNRDDYLKFDLDCKNVRYELYTGNHVFIPELKKKYEVIIDRQMDFTYTPYM
jgi:hypothetical protein